MREEGTGTNYLLHEHVYKQVADDQPHQMWQNFFKP